MLKLLLVVPATNAVSEHSLVLFEELRYVRSLIFTPIDHSQNFFLDSRNSAILSSFLFKLGQ